MKEIIKETAQTLNMEVEVVDKIIKTYLQFIKSNISKIRYKELSTFLSIKTNFLLSGFGKLVVKNKTDKRLQHEKRIKEVKH